MKVIITYIWWYCIGEFEGGNGMDLNKIDYVIAVADLKNISKAATACFVSQPALTRYIQGLRVFDTSQLNKIH